MSKVPPLIHDGHIHGGQIQCAREARGMSRKELAGKLGMTVRALAQWERGGRQVPYGDFLLRLQFVTGFRPEFFRLDYEPLGETTLDWHFALQRREQYEWLLRLQAHHHQRRGTLDAATLRQRCAEALSAVRSGWSSWGRQAGCCGHIHKSLVATVRCLRGTDRIAVRLRPVLSWH